MAKCRACGADIVWIKTKSGKSMPCNAAPIAYRELPWGPLTLATRSGDIVKAEYDSTSRTVAYEPHFASCPAADSYRKGR